MIVLGVLLLVLGYVLGVHVLVTIGVILLVLGIVLLLVGHAGPVSGRWW